MLVPLFWKISLDAESSEKARALSDDADPELVRNESLHVTLLFIGGRRREDQAASLNMLSLEDFLQTLERLKSMIGRRLEFSVDAVYHHPELVAAKVVLPTDVPCASPQPYLTLCKNPETPPVFARSLVAGADPALAAQTLVRRLDGPLALSGTVELESGEGWSSQLQRERERRSPQEAVGGPWLHVKKHSSMGCAVLTFKSGAIRDSVLARASGKILVGEARIWS